MDMLAYSLKRRRRVIIGSVAVAIALAAVLVLEYFDTGNEAGVVLGNKESVIIITDKGPVTVTAKIDTGADYSAIDSTLADSLGLHKNNLKRRVTNAQGTQLRDTADISYELGSRQIDTIVSLADRAQLSTEMIIGRSDMQDFTIDPNKQFLNEPHVSGQKFSWAALLARATNRSLNKQIILMPILAVMVVAFRLLVGIKTFGVFGPVVIALSLILMQPNIWQGVLIYVILVSVGVAMKLLIFSRLRLPNVAEMSLMMATIVGLLLAFAFLPLAFQVSATAVFFPLIITTHLVERFSRTVEENYLKEAVVLLVSTLVLSILIALIGIQLLNLSMNLIWLLFAISIFLVIVIGNYTGMRLNEYARFIFLRKK